MADLKPTDQTFSDRSYGPQRPDTRGRADNRRSAARRDQTRLHQTGPETVDQTFNRENSAYNSIQNAQVIREEKNREKQKTRTRLRQMAAQEEEVEKENLTRAERVALAIRAQAIQTDAKSGIFNKVQKNVARIRVISVASTVAIWSTPIYLVIILPLGLVATILFGIAAGLWATFGITSDGTTMQSIWGFVGVGIAGQLAQAFMGLFFVMGVLIFFLNAVIIAAASAEFKIAFIKPWFGSAAALKIACIILALICSFLPLVQMAPLALLWVATVFFYPK